MLKKLRLDDSESVKKLLIRASDEQTEIISSCGKKYVKEKGNSLVRTKKKSARNIAIAVACTNVCNLITGALVGGTEMFMGNLISAITTTSVSALVAFYISDVDRKYSDFYDGFNESVLKWYPCRIVDVRKRIQPDFFCIETSVRVDLPNTGELNAWFMIRDTEEIDTENAIIISCDGLYCVMTREMLGLTEKEFRQAFIEDRPLRRDEHLALKVQNRIESKRSKVKDRLIKGDVNNFGEENVSSVEDLDSVRELNEESVDSTERGVITFNRKKHTSMSYSSSQSKKVSKAASGFDNIDAKMRGRKANRGEEHQFFRGKGASTGDELEKSRSNRVKALWSGVDDASGETKMLGSLRDNRKSSNFEYNGRIEDEPISKANDFMESIKAKRYEKVNDDSESNEYAELIKKLNLGDRPDRAFGASNKFV